ncbi:MAG: hypothetical protein JWM56_723 [Candidatus Peribacteria bacterium]|nr:hypothetical protein [Candidatus Peribacteria bacterium]
MRRSTLLFTTDNGPTKAFAQFLRDVQVPGNDLISIDAALQARFFQKGPDGKPLERWELEASAVMCPADRIRLHLRLCGFIDCSIPRCWAAEYADWPGALLPRALARLKDLNTVWKSGVRWNQTVVHGGKRPLLKDRESPNAMISLVEEVFDCEVTADEADRHYDRDLQTELQMMEALWHLAPFDQELRAIPVTFVDAPMKPPLKEGDSPVRPSTEDTILEWLQGNPTPGHHLLSSGAPYGMAQDEAFWMLLESHGHTVETFGHAAPDLPIETFMREVAGTVNRIRKSRLG